MNTRANKITLDVALINVPSSFRNRLISSYKNLKTAFIEGKFDLCGLRAGKFAEVLLRYLQYYLTKNYIQFSKKIPNFTSECKLFEQLPRTTGPESFRIVIPRALTFLYTLRNKRGIGHIGGDVDANEIDAATMVRLADWCICEVIRVVHTLSLEEAQTLLDSLTTRQVPKVWQVVGKKRVLDASMDYRSQTLLLLYSETSSGIPVEDLFEWTGHSNSVVYKQNIIIPLHKQRYIEYDRDTETAIISPLGIKKVEEDLFFKENKD